MSNEENLRVALQHLLSLEEHSAFYENYIEKQEIKTSTDLDEFSERSNHILTVLVNGMMSLNLP